MNIRNRILVKTVILLFLTITAQHVFAFGKNKVITKDFDWKICQSEHFDIYYYDEGKNILPTIVDILERSYSYLCDTYICDIASTTPYFLYIGHNDFEQTNIVSIGEGTGGVTEAYKNRFIVPHLGPKQWLEDVLRHELTHVLQFNVLYGGFWKSVRLVKSIIYPYWIMEGMAVFSERDYDLTERSMYMRDAVMPRPGDLSYDEPVSVDMVDEDGLVSKHNGLLPLGYLHNFNHVKPHQVVLAYKQSGTLIEYLTEEYGYEKILEILNIYKDSFDPNTVLDRTLGLTLFDLDRKFMEYVKETYTLNTEHLREPDSYGYRITPGGDFYEFDTNPTPVPGTENLLYITDRNGYNEIVLLDKWEDDVQEVISQKNFKDVENINRSGKGIALTADGNYMFFIGEKRQKDYIFRYDFKKNRLKKIKTTFDIIDSVDITPDGKRIYFTAMKDSYRNIYAMDASGSNLTQLTFETDDISDAVVSPDNSFIVFSREIKTDSETNRYQRDLWLYSLTDQDLSRLTDMPNDETSPCIAPDGKSVVFVSDKDNIYNLYRINLATRDVEQLTQVVGGNFTPAFSQDGTKLFFSSFRYGEKHIYSADMEDFNASPLLTAYPSFNILNENYPDLPPIKPYRFTASTDLFFPFMMYSTYEGLYTAILWQISEMTGNHSLSIYTQYYEASRYLDYQLTYSYLRYRPQVFFSVYGQGGFTDWFASRYEERHAQVVGISYPLDRFNRFEFAVGNIIETTELLTNGITQSITNERSHLGQISYFRDTTKGKYMEITAGSRFGISLQGGTDMLGADTIYQNAEIEAHNFLSLGREQTLASRIVGATSKGQDKYLYRLIGYNGVRMRRQSSMDNINYGTNILFANIEWRLPIVSDLNYYMWYMFPDFLFRSFYGIVFFDAGLAWYDDESPSSNDMLYSFGVGLKFHSFVLQMYPFSLNFTWAYSPINDITEFYFMFGPVF